MNSSKKIVISASRRTDIPAFYMDWFMNRVDQGNFKVVNPYNRRVSSVSASPENIHTFVFWSKNFSQFIRNRYGDKLLEMGYNLFFNFTINSDSSFLEPNVPPLEQRIRQLEYLCRHFGAKSINWRFDPLCFYKTKGGELRDNLHDFSFIAGKASEFGINRCITSFMDDYPKIRKRLKSFPGFSFVDPPLVRKIRILLKMERTLLLKGISLKTCCEKKLLELLPAESSISQSSCIPNDLLAEIFGGQLSFKKDTGQRTKKGCGCMVSVDIGSYHLHPCYHRCLFCYANPSVLE